MRPTRIEISRRALEQNIAYFRSIAPGKEIIAVVKANAYGHGMNLVAPVLEPLVDAFGVAFAEEGAALRSIGITKPIIVLMTPTSDDAEEIVEHDLDVVACSLDVMERLDAVAARSRRRVRCHLYVDTGMHRDGIAPEEVPAFAEACTRLEQIEVVGICTHFARSDERDCQMTTRQNQRFAVVLNQLLQNGYRFRWIHAANTGAALQHPATHYSALRVGIGIYGIAPGQTSAPQLRPALRLVTNVTALRSVRAGETVSYGTHYVAARDTTVATIPIGYGDGFVRMLTGNAECLIGGKRYPIVGAICMDECMVDVGGDPIALGDEVVLIGRQGNQCITAREIADRLGTIPYEVTTLLGNRLERILVP
ncbi:MAG: alanine racemase [Candidatus Kapaibacterium sp.]|nr:MAG: alanine racemase [Candidatus Kapabacteria bacterium]